MKVPAAEGEEASDIKKLLLADLEHFGESMWRNEETGEKRFSFFLTLVTAVVGGLVALASSDHGPIEETMRGYAGMALVILLVVGELTYLRMLQRNRVTDEYQHTLTYIRDTYVGLCTGSIEYVVPVGRDGSKSRSRWAPSRLLKGGYVETIGSINALLIVGLLIVYLEWSPALAWMVGLVILLLQWLPAAFRRKG